MTSMIPNSETPPKGSLTWFHSAFELFAVPARRTSANLPPGVLIKASSKKPSDRTGVEIGAGPAPS